MSGQWRRSGRCNANNGCVELRAAGGWVLVRDGKDRDGSPVLPFTRPTWARFLTSVKTTGGDLR